jgi:hypothetical protein
MPKIVTSLNLSKKTISRRLKAKSVNKLSENIKKSFKDHTSQKTLHARKSSNHQYTQNNVGEELSSSSLNLSESHEDNNAQDYLLLPLNEFLSKLYTDYNLPRFSGNVLLKYLKKHYDDSLPKDIRSLLKTPRNHDIRYVDPGSYIHISIKYTLKILLSAAKVKSGSVILIDYFLDGIQISKSSKRSVWIILGMIIILLILIIDTLIFMF